MDGNPNRSLSRAPHPPGRIMTNAPPGFMLPSTGTPPSISETTNAVNNTEPEEILNSPINIDGEKNIFSLESSGEHNRQNVLGTVVNCSDLEDMLLGRSPQKMNGIVDKLNQFSQSKDVNMRIPHPPASTLPFFHQHKMVLPEHQMKRHYGPPIGAFSTSNAPVLFPRMRVDSRPKLLPPPPGFEIPSFRSSSIPLQPLPGFSLEPVHSPQPWSPARQASGLRNSEELNMKNKVMLLNTEIERTSGASITSHRGQVVVDQEALEKKMKKKEEKEKRRALKKKQKRAAKLLEKTEKKGSSQTTVEGLSSSDSVPPDNINISLDSSKENDKLQDNGLTSVDTKNENIKKKKKKKEKIKNENTNSEDKKVMTSIKKRKSKKGDELKQGVFSSKVILSEDGESIIGLVDQIDNVSIDENCQPEEEKSEKQRKEKKAKKKEERFEDYISLKDLEKGLQDKTLIENELRINPKNYTEAYISDPDNGQDILILGLVDRNRSLEGDIVVVKLKEESDWHKSQNGLIYRTGKVVFVTERVHHGSTVGTLHLRKKGLYMLMPRDQRFPLLRIPSTSIPTHILSNINEGQKSDILYRAVLLSWNTPKFANGIIQEVVGKKGEIASETAAIFLELGLNQNPVPEAYHRFLPNLPYIISPEEIKSRVDLRSQVIFTIDPSTARDLDDAVSVKKLSETTFEVGVHISDVTHFLKEGTPLDIEVSERATTVYMVERAYHMLPIALCGLCSLLPGEDKLAISVIMKLDEEGNVLDKQISRTVINSCAQLSYDHAQAIIEGKEIEFPEIYNNVPFSEIQEAILLLNKIAVNRRAKRFESGALQIGQPKICFSINSDCLPQDMFIYEIKDSHRLIEEFMLLANEIVARHIHSKFPDIALLRRHDPPKADMMAKLENSLQRLGIFLDSSWSGSLHASLTRYCGDDELRTSALNYMCTKSMQRAVYFCSSEDTHHYALNLDKYTHFTSPIRRYADVVVHRILTACLGYTPLPPWNKDDVKKFAANSNRKKFAAKKAGDMSSNLFRAIYIKQLGGIEVQGVIIGVNSHSIDVIIPTMDHNMRVYLEKLENVKFEFRENDIASSLVVEWPGIEELQLLQVFCSVKIYLTVSEKSSTTIEAKLLPPDS